MDLDRVAEMYVLGTLPADRLPAIASEALEAGYDSPSLRQLAGAYDLDSEDLRTLFNISVRELHMQMPTPVEAGRSAARRIADEIARGVIPPYEGAKQIWTEIYTRFPHLTELRPFVGFASQYEDDQTHRDENSRFIIAESKRLLAERR